MGAERADRRAGNLTQDWARAMIDVALARESDVDQATDTIVEIAEQTVARPELADRVLEPPKAVGLVEMSDDRLMVRVTVKVAKGAAGRRPPCRAGRAAARVQGRAADQPARDRLPGRRGRRDRGA